MMYPILFRVGVWDEEERNDYGVIMAPSYTDAAKELETMYEGELLEMELFMCEEGPLYINKELYDCLKHETY